MSEPSPFVRMLVRVVKAARAAGLKPDPAERTDATAEQGRRGGDWEGLGRDLGRAFRKFRDGGPQKP